MTTLSSAEKLVAELSTNGLTVDSYVVRRHDAVVRVLNPPRSADGQLLTWQTVVGDEFAPASDLQWQDVADRGRLGAITAPRTGAVDPRVAKALLGELPVPDSRKIHVAQWDGYADIERPASAQRLTFPPGRESWVWSLPIRDVPLLGRVPMRWWHPDLHWVVGNDIYGRSVFVSATVAVIRAVLASPYLEAFPVNAGDPVGAEDF